MELVLTTQSSNMVTIEKYTKNPPPRFLERVYIDCAHKYGERVNLTHLKNGSDKLKLIQLFKPSDGIYLQYFQNKTGDILWKHKVNFKYENMKLFGARKKNVKHNT